MLIGAIAEVGTVLGDPKEPIVPTDVTITITADPTIPDIYRVVVTEPRSELAATMHADHIAGWVTEAVTSLIPAAPETVTAQVA